MFIRELLAVMLGGALGSSLRFVLSRWMQEQMPKGFPWGILSANVLGCLLIGFLSGFLVHRFGLSPVLRAGIFIGVLGGFTTFSSFSLDTIQLLQDAAYGIALANVLISLLCCLGATALGLQIAKLIAS